MNTIEEEYKRAYDQAIRLLARRDHSEWELQRKLLQGKTSPEVLRRVCERCQEQGFLNDAKFAMSRARYRLLHGHYGPGRVWAELRSLHVDKLNIQQAIDALLAENDEVHLATVALTKRFGATTDDSEMDKNDRYYETDGCEADDGYETDGYGSDGGYEAERHEAGLRKTGLHKAGRRKTFMRSQAFFREREKKRRYDYLARRGFSNQTIWQILE